MYTHVCVYIFIYTCCAGCAGEREYATLADARARGEEQQVGRPLVL